MDLGGLDAAGIQEEGCEADADVQELSRDFVLVDEDAPFAVDGDQT